jgi:hypothetical protein
MYRTTRYVNPPRAEQQGADQAIHCIVISRKPLQYLSVIKEVRLAAD